LIAMRSVRCHALDAWALRGVRAARATWFRYRFWYKRTDAAVRPARRVCARMRALHATQPPQRRCQRTTALGRLLRLFRPGAPRGL